MQKIARFRDFNDFEILSNVIEMLTYLNETSLES